MQTEPKFAPGIARSLVNVTTLVSSSNMPTASEPNAPFVLVDGQGDPNLQGDMEQAIAFLAWSPSDASVRFGRWVVQVWPSKSDPDVMVIRACRQPIASSALAWERHRTAVQRGPELEPAIRGVINCCLFEMFKPKFAGDRE